MRLLPLVIAFLLGTSLLARAQEVPEVSQRTWSIELGTGIIPYHISFIPTRATKKVLAQQGQAVGDVICPYYPAFSLSGAYHHRKYTEFRFTVGAAWRYYNLIQYSTFGTDPDGNPRYNLNDGSPAGWAVSRPVFSFTIQCFHVWNPGRTAELYSGGGIGLVIDNQGLLTGSVFPFPDFTPIGVRVGGKHLYGFGELTLGPIATLFHGGVGCRF